MQPMVYNRDFIQRNFQQSSDLKGIFTLGEKNVETINKIDEAKEAVDELTGKLEGLTITLQGTDDLGGKKAELATVEREFCDKCWAQKRKHDPKLSGAFEGYRNNAENFKAKVLEERQVNRASLQALAVLEKRAETVFGQMPAAQKTFASVDTARLAGFEASPILAKHVVGKGDVDIAAMIQRLGNSDWVRQGRTYFDANEDVCPFCQQETPAGFARALADYFDDTFEQDTKAISELEAKYKTESERVQKQLEAILAAPSNHLDTERLRAEKALLEQRMAENVRRLAAKKKEPSQAVTLEAVGDAGRSITEILSSANNNIAIHNQMVANLPRERKVLTDQVWKYLLEVELPADLKAYDSKRMGLNEAIESISSQIKETKLRKAKKEKEIRELEKQITSIQPTINAINALLSSFGFSGFSLANADDCYKLARPDGTDAKQTLSEGEQSFVTFLYFFHLLKGSDSESGVVLDRVVVFDDPVSSLDSDILFIVGALIKGLFEEVRTGAGHIKQVFVLTHNIYFHKEVTFNPRRQDRALNEETFWVVRKSGLLSKLERHPSNPIKTCYELLWSEVRRPDKSSPTIQNTLRRILENYFKILGSIDPDQICSMFDGKEKLICRSLFSWVNAGSHDASDDLYVSISESMLDRYLAVFRGIFEKSGNLGHYRMMMGDAYVELLPPAV